MRIALELPNGQIVKLTKLRPGQHATVLQMPASPQTRTVPQKEVQDIAIA